MEEHKNDMFEDLEQILSVKQGIFYNFPYQANGEWIQDAFWYDKPDDTLWEEKLDNMIDYYPKLHASLIDRSSELNNDLLYHLNVELISKIELPRSIDPYYASFVLFPARENILAQIGIIMKAPHPNSRNVLKYQIDDFVIAEICHIDFDKYKDYKPKRNECHYDYLRRLIRGARGNRGFITVNDSFEILVPRSKASWAHDFQKARCYYFECLYKKSNQENAQLIQNEQLTLDTMMKDLGYDASKFLDEKYKVTNRRPSRQFSDPLFVQFRETWTDLQWKKRGRYYTTKKEVDIDYAAKINGANNVLISYDTDPPHDMYMDTINYMYNQINHRFYLKFANRKRVKDTENDQNIHV